ncbi:hypothetical protein WMY93_033526 [Mugilogobius chulae]|uniref:SPRY-associated domain-containing protein n=1 Tax=Mugilogobius chulae TaxID=88201 RepID=A0AAW0MH26_9GOBI
MRLGLPARGISLAGPLQNDRARERFRPRPSPGALKTKTKSWSARVRDETKTLNARVRDETKTLNAQVRDETKTLNARVRDETKTLKNGLETSLETKTGLEYYYTRLDHAGAVRLAPGLRKYFCDLTLDPNTAHRKLKLSDNNKKVTRVREEQPYPDHQDRFEYWAQLLCVSANLAFALTNASLHSESGSKKDEKKRSERLFGANAK